MQKHHWAPAMPDPVSHKYTVDGSDFIRNQGNDTFPTVSVGWGASFLSSKVDITKLLHPKRARETAPPNTMQMQHNPTAVSLSIDTCDR